VNRQDLDRLLRDLAEVDGSDLHLKSGAPPRRRVNGQLSTLNEPRLTPEDTAELVLAIMPPKLREMFETKQEVDFAYAVRGLGRFRVNAYRQRGSVALAMRLVHTNPATVADLGLPDVVRRMAESTRGLILLTGPTGSGKTTTLAAMVNHINHTRACHIITIEDPIEYLHRDDLAAIEQREVGFDTESFTSAMRVVLRQDPDVILVGEMRDTETVYTALTAAETGHLVLSTLHTRTATETVNRVVDFFRADEQQQVRVSLGSGLVGTICQRLIPRTDGAGRVPAAEIMVVNGRIQQAILDPLKTSEIDRIIAEGEYYGMQSFDQSVAGLMRDGVINLKDAMDAASNPHDLKIMLEKMGVLATGFVRVPAATR
jgi:twitching motility protein PilT